FSSRRRHTRFSRDWSSDVCSSDLAHVDHIGFSFGWKGQSSYQHDGIAGLHYPMPGKHFMYQFHTLVGVTLEKYAKGFCSPNYAQLADNTRIIGESVHRDARTMPRDGTGRGAGSRQADDGRSADLFGELPGRIAERVGRIVFPETFQRPNLVLFVI